MQPGCSVNGKLLGSAGQSLAVAVAFDVKLMQRHDMQGGQVDGKGHPVHGSRAGNVKDPV